MPKCIVCGKEYPENPEALLDLYKSRVILMGGSGRAGDIRAKIMRGELPLNRVACVVCVERREAEDRHSADCLRASLFWVWQTASNPSTAGLVGN